MNEPPRPLPPPPPPSVPPGSPGPLPATPGPATTNGRRPPLGLIIAGVAAVVVAISIVIAMVGGGDDDDGVVATATSPPSADTAPNETASAVTAPDDTVADVTEPVATEPADTEPADTAAEPERVIRSGGEELAFGEALAGELVSEEDVGRYEFDGRAGETVRILVQSADAKVLNPKVFLLGPDGESVADSFDISASNRNSELSVALDVDGTHVVEVASTRGAGPFELTVEVDDHVGDADTPVEIYTADEQTLWEQIPEDVDDTCVPVDPFESALASFVCLGVTEEGTNVTYDLFPDATTLDAVYETYMSDVVADTGDSTQCPSEFGYDRAEVPTGRIKCTITTEGARIVYTSTCDGNILVYAMRDDEQFAPLFLLWSDDVLGPLCP